MLPRKISPVWLVISLVFGFAVSGKESLHPSLVTLGMAFTAFGAYLIGKAEEHYVFTKEGKGIYDYVRHPMYLGTSLFLIGVSVAMESVVLWIVALVWTIGALYLAWKESHSSSSS